MQLGLLSHCFGHPATKVKGLKCPSPFAYKKQNWLVRTSQYKSLFMCRFRSSSSSTSCIIVVLLPPLPCVISLHWCFFFFLHGCWSSVCGFSCWWLLILCCWPYHTYFLCIVLLLFHCCRCCFSEWMIVLFWMLLILVWCCCLKQCRKQKWYFSGKSHTDHQSVWWNQNKKLW